MIDFPKTGFPTGTVTFLFTDIAGSTQLLQHLGEGYPTVLSTHRQLLRAACIEYGGYEFGTQGDSLFVAFARAHDAVAAAVAAQRALATQQWPESAMVRVRMGLHTGEPTTSHDNYEGLDVHRVARLVDAGHGGQVLLSQTTRDLVENDLPEHVSLRDLGEYWLRDLQRAEHLFQLVVQGLPCDFPSLRALHYGPHNLPTQLTCLLGREKEVAAARELLRQDDVRLVTLTGPGGTGKTRLCLQIAAEMSDDFRQGVYFVPLASVSDPAFVIPTIAQTLGVKEIAGQPLIKTLQDYLCDRQTLLVLDNFEQIVAAASLIAELLTACARLKVLVTSRIVLHLRGEHEFAVPPLALPDLKHLPPIEALSQYAAVALFIQRARSVKPNFAISNKCAPAVAEICAHLDGLPLAIELAAARSKMFAPPALLARLLGATGQSSLKLLTGGARDLPARHQTLQAAIAWSYDLLEAAEQNLFRWVAVFAGGCTVEAATAVYCGVSDPSLETDVLEKLASLADQSLLRQEIDANGEPRFTMLETIREYGLERLVESGAKELAQRRHAEYYLVMALQSSVAGEDFHRKQCQTLLQKSRACLTDHMAKERLAPVRYVSLSDVESDNLRAALAWLIEHEPEMALVMTDIMPWAWSELTEARGWFNRALAQGREISLTRARSLFHAGYLAMPQSDYTAARALFEESLAIYRQVGEPRDIANMILALGNIDEIEGNLAAARARMKEGLALVQELEDKTAIANLLGAAASVALADCDFATARSLLEESLAVTRESNNLGPIGWLLINRGQMARREGKYEEAAACFAESLVLNEEQGNLLNLAQLDFCRAWLARCQGDCTGAVVLFRQSLIKCRELVNKNGIVTDLNGLAGIAGTNGQPERAACLFGAAAALLESIGSSLSPFDHLDYDPDLAATRGALDDETFAATWASGQAMAWEQAVEYALQEDQDRINISEASKNKFHSSEPR